jgi:type IV pilus assembly protein PilQ
MSRHTLVPFILAAAVAANAHAQQDAAGQPARAPADARSDTVTLNVQQQPLGQVLEMISVQQHVNIVAGVDTTVPVTANFYDASLEQSLDWVLAPLGFAWTFDGKVYEVMPATDYDLIQRPLVHHTFRPNYVSVAELEKFLTQFLSPQGRIVASEAPATGGVASTTGASGSSGGATAGITSGLASVMPETLIVIDQQSAIDKMVEMVRELDERPRQVLVEATILEIKLDETNRFGVDLSILGDSQFEDFESLFQPGQVYSPTADFVESGYGPGSTAAGAPFLTPEGTTSFNQSGFTEGGDGMRFGWVGSNVAIFLEALQTVADTNVLANTKVLALNKQRGEIIIGGRLGYFGGTTVSDGISQQTVEFLEVGTQLRFRPFIGNDGFVRLEIHPQRSSGIVDPTTGLPTEQTSEVTTNIMIRDGETVAIGGLIETRDVNTTSRVPILGYLPGIGWLFSTEETEIERNEIVVLLTPHILEDGATYGDTDSLVEDSKADTRQMRQNAGPVARVEQAFRTLEDARAALERGDLDEARLLCDRSLLLDPLADGALELSREIDARLEEDAHDGG